MLKKWVLLQRLTITLLSTSVAKLDATGKIATAGDKTDGIFTIYFKDIPAGIK